MCRAIDLARYGSRAWKLVALEKLNRHYGTSLSLKEANAIFDAYVLDHSKPVRKRPCTIPGMEAEFVYDFYLTIDQGEIYFEFTLDEDDPEDPVIQIVSVHPPSFKSKQ